jgi:hypothetical protein
MPPSPEAGHDAARDPVADDPLLGGRRLRPLGRAQDDEPVGGVVLHLLPSRAVRRAVRRAVVHVVVHVVAVARVTVWLEGMERGAGRATGVRRPGAAGADAIGPG